VSLSDLQPYWSKFLLFYVDLFLTTMCAASLSFLVGASVNSFGVGQGILVMVFVLMMVSLFIYYKIVHEVHDRQTYSKTYSESNKKPAINTNTRQNIVYKITRKPCRQ